MHFVFSKLFGRSRTDDQPADELYTTIVAQARQPDFYQRLGVPDTIDGRLEMIFLHLVLLFHRLRRDGEAGQELTQRVFNRFVTDMDRSLREMGVGDLGVPKRMKAIGQSFYGRLEAYGMTIANGDRNGLANSLERNLWPEGPVSDKMPTLAVYAERGAAMLHGQQFAAISGGALSFPHPVDPASE